MTLKVIFWFYVAYLAISVCVRLYQFLNNKNSPISVVFEWLLAVSCTIGIYSVAYKKAILFPLFWGVLGLLAIITTIFRISGSYVADAAPELSQTQIFATKIVMLIWLIPLVSALFVNAFNITGLWPA